MATHEQIYQNHTQTYDGMIGRQPKLTDTIRAIRDFTHLDIVDLGAGSGRLAEVLVEEARSLICTDRSSEMLTLLDQKLRKRKATPNWKTITADHRSLPIKDHSVDLVVAGWTLCYLTNDGKPEWKQHLADIHAELQRILREDGTMIIFETMGTGTETPDPPHFLQGYYNALEQEYGFRHQWIRMDYVFRDVEEAALCTQLFFGKPLADKIRQEQWSTVPECAGIWWKHMMQDGVGR